MKDNPLVSVIMTVYNGEQHIPDAINCIQQQTLANWEFVIVDDGSQDRTQDLLMNAASKDPRIRVIASGRIGRAKALNMAWRNARGRYIANLDVDDLARPERLRCQAQLLETHPNIGLVSTDVLSVQVDDQGNQVDVTRKQLPTDSFTLKRLLVQTNPFTHSSIMIPRNVLEFVGGYNESFTVAIDYELWVRIAERFELTNIPETLTEKHLHSQRYFYTEISLWERARAISRIRWYAWRHSPHRLQDLWYVFVEPNIVAMRKTTNRQLKKFQQPTAGPILG